MLRQQGGPGRSCVVCACLGHMRVRATPPLGPEMVFPFGETVYYGTGKSQSRGRVRNVRGSGTYIYAGVELKSKQTTALARTRAHSTLSPVAAICASPSGSGLQGGAHCVQGRFALFFVRMLPQTRSNDQCRSEHPPGAVPPPGACAHMRACATAPVSACERHRVEARGPTGRVAEKREHRIAEPWRSKSLSLRGGPGDARPRKTATRGGSFIP